MATIKDVAKKAGVSIATVSRVINKSPQASKAAITSVEEAMKSLGYRPNANARALVSRKTNTIGVLVSDVSDPFFGSLLKAVDKVARQNNKHLLIGNGDYDANTEREAIEFLINSCSESLVLHSKALPDKELIALAKEAPGLVLINRYIPEIAKRCIFFDNLKGAYIATEFLIRNGHKHIAYINSDNNIDDAYDRKAGYINALKDNGLPTPDNYIIAAQATDQGGKEAMIRLLSTQHRITAVVAYNDSMAAGALLALEDSNIAVPDEISVIGFDNGLISRYVRPKLTTINYPIQIMAEQAAQLSLELIKNSDYSAINNSFVPTLVIRGSVSHKSG